MERYSGVSFASDKSLKVDFTPRGSGKPSHQWKLEVTGLSPEEQSLANAAANEEKTDEFDEQVLPKIIKMLAPEARTEVVNAYESAVIEIFYDSDTGVLVLRNE